MIHFPERSWRLIKEYYFMKPILKYKKSIAKACQHAVQTDQLGLRLWVLGKVDQRTRPHYISSRVRKGNLAWNYPATTVLDTKGCPYNNTHYTSMFQDDTNWLTWSGLNLNEWKQLLEINGLKDTSTMTKHELIHAYLKL